MKIEDAMLTHKEMYCPKCKSDDTATFRRKQTNGSGGFRKATLHNCKNCMVIFNDDGKLLPLHK
jgi:RNA polymerase subunit RPABC4/transcription elongation factor Spt4